MQSIKMEDVFSIHFLSDVKLSPSGEHAAFVVTEGSLEENKYNSYIWVYNTKDGNMRKLTAAGAEKSITWLDDTNIIFPTARLDKDKEMIKKGAPVTIYYKINIFGGEAEKLFTVPGKVSNIKPICGGRFLVSALHDNCAPDFLKMPEAEKEKALKEMSEANAAYKIFDEIPFWSNGKGVTNKKRNRLYIYEPTNNTFNPISPPLMNVMSFATNKATGQIAFTGVEFENMMELISPLYIYDINTSQTTKVEMGDDYNIQNVEFADDDIIMFARLTRERNASINYLFYKVPVTGGNASVFYDGDISLGNSVGSDCKYGGGTSFKKLGGDFYYISTRGYSSYLHKLTQEAAETCISADVSGTVDCFDMNEHIAVYVGVRNKGLQELYVLDKNSGTETLVSCFNKKWIAEHVISYPEYFSFKNRDGVDLDGFVIKPISYDAGKKYPAILDMHGGPKATYGDILFHEMQLWSSEGYFVFFTNPRGSDGRGSEFADINGERYCNWDYNDFMDFTDKVLDRYPQIDTSNVGATGGSYGGLMANWMIGHTHRFKAVASQRSISNYVSKCLTTDIGYYHNLSQMETDPWHDNNVFWDHSPLKYADKCVTPTLFIQSDEDYRCYMADAIQMFTALKMHGCEARLCLFHGENHELSRSGKPKNRVKRLDEITSWFNHYMK